MVDCSQKGIVRLDGVALASWAMNGQVLEEVLVLRRGGSRRAQGRKEGMLRLKVMV